MKLTILRSRRFWLLAGGGVALALLSSQLPLQDWFVNTGSWLTSLGVVAIPAFIGLYLLATVGGLPNIVLILVAGAVFGLAQGIVVASVADTLGAIACFGVGRTLARDRIQRWMVKNPGFARLDHAVGQKGWKILLLTRLSPLVPSNLLNYGFSCTKVNFWQYCFCSWIGMLPVITLYVYLGSFGVALFQDGLTTEKLALQGGGAVLAIAAGWYTTNLTRKALQPEHSGEVSEQDGDYR
ncbi:TVP38/TMEM64 family protein [Leptolyngbya sp. CCNP1308]|uniref:TVP38/TMEM64 family protein n=1 Tax=Leptolyngbya sp. CCNP1308 TaxID=3110255 RepID=UPI002B1F5248|nr:TVP38/TMEM64 family protein [Leptolyngbya sp. CCNP1308]MEA5451852.1 TVP38/TMEM64 family protein [Leptolyngbya sp. CCNP1308]